MLALRSADVPPDDPAIAKAAEFLVENWRTAREQIIRIDPDLILIPGDITRDGSIHRFEFEEMKNFLVVDMNRNR